MNDHMVWLKDAGVVDINGRFTQRRYVFIIILQKQQSMSDSRFPYVFYLLCEIRSDQWWLISIVFTLARDLYDLSVALSERARRQREEDRNGNRKKDDDWNGNGAAIVARGGSSGWVNFAKQVRESAIKGTLHT